MVSSARKEGGAWTLTCASGETIRSDTLLFANGGYGAQATASELAHFAVSDTRYVHARNTRILRDTALHYGWEHDESNAWYLEFVDEQPKWFLWDAKATVLAGNATLYDEAASYDERGRERRKCNASVATLLYEDATSGDVPTAGEMAAVSGAAGAKACNTRSKRLWRNFLAQAYNGTVVSTSECSARIRADTPVRRKAIHQGMIDTISGPKTDQHHRVRSDPSVYVAGNAGAPHLYEAYLGPGSTLGNALVSGYAAGRHAVAA